MTRATKKFVKKESYTHLYAKQLLAEWLKAGFNVECNEVKMRVKEGNQGTILEYPITNAYPYLPEEVGKPDDKWLAVADVATIHKGIVSYTFEVVNKNEDIGDKLELYSAKNGLAFFINASHILGQIKPPETLQAIAITRYGKIIRD